LSARVRVVAAAVVASLVVASPVAALDLASGCRKAFGKAGAVLVTSVLSAEQGCLTLSAKGRLAAGTVCSDTGASIGPITEPKTHAKLTAAIARARAAVEKRCTGVDVAAPAPTGLGIRACGSSPACAAITVQDVASLADCVECAHVAAAHAILAVQHADSTKPATGPSSGGSPRRVSQTSGVDGNGCGGSEQPCRTIQYAVNASSTNDEILVAAGTYTYDAGLDPCAEYIDSHAIVCVLNKRLTIRGGYADGAWSTADPDQNPTVIDGADQRRGVLVQRTSSGAPAAGLVMEGFTVRRGRVQGTASGGDAKTFAFGAGLLADFSTIELRDMVFRDNQALGGDTSSAYGGAAAGGGVALRACPSTTVENVTFESNRAEGGSGGDRGGFGIGGGLFTFETTLAASDLTFTNNRAIGGNTSGNGIAGGERGDGQGGGLAIQEGSDAVVTRVTAIDNQAIGGNAATNAGGAFGGGLYAEKATFAFSDALVEGNVAVGGNGANGGFGSGGGVMTMNVGVTIDRARIVDNRSSGGDGSVNAGPCGGGGAYLSRLGGTGSATIRNTVVAGNETEMGSSGALPGGGGGGLFLQGLQTTIEHATIADNRIGTTAMQGSGVVIISGTSNASVDIRHSILADHGGAGAALHVQPSNSVTLVRGIFSGNAKDTNSDGSVGAPGTFTGLGTMLSTGPLGFLSPGAPSFDYHIAPSSPAVNQATSSNYTVDLDNQPRTGTPDIGADEATP
jgi:hypothetical protein